MRPSVLGTVFPLHNSAWPGKPSIQAATFNYQNHVFLFKAMYIGLYNKNLRVERLSPRTSRNSHEQWSKNPLDTSQSPYTCVYMYGYIYIYTCACIYIYIYIHIYMYYMSMVEILSSPCITLCGVATMGWHALSVTPNPERSR